MWSDQCRNADEGHGCEARHFDPKKKEKNVKESDSSMHLAKIRARTQYSFCVAFYKRKLEKNLSLLHTHISGALAMTLS
jgi:hypothetical protein